MKKYRSFTAGVVATLMAVSTVGTALAASSRVEYNKAGISLFGENKVLTGESYKAPNGQDVPSVITYVDETGGKTNYLSIRQISELLDASVGWNAATNSVDMDCEAEADCISAETAADADDLCGWMQGYNSIYRKGES